MGNYMALIRPILWNSVEQRVRVGWRLLLYTLFWLYAPRALDELIGPWLAARPEGSRHLPSAVILKLVVVLAITWLAARHLDRRPFADYGLRINGQWWIDFCFGLALGALLMTLVFMVEWLAGWVIVQETFHVAMPGISFAVAILGALLLFVVVGVTEELLARGYHLLNIAEALSGEQGDKVTRWQSFWNLDFRFWSGHGAQRAPARVKALPVTAFYSKIQNPESKIASPPHPVTPSPSHQPAAMLTAWIVSSSLFGLLHIFNPNATWYTTLALMIAGLFLGLGFLLTGSLALPIGLHISWNFVQGNVFGFPVSGNQYQSATFFAIEQHGPVLWTGGAFGPEAGLVGLLAIFLGCGLTIWWVRWQGDKVKRGEK
jgi:membrane protease YdiL (CAAX protease family)